MTDSNRKNPPALFWVVAIIAVLWNLMGVGAYLADAFMTSEMLNALPQEQQDLYAERPAWVVGAFAIAVWGGLLGSIALLVRKKWARPMFLISLIGVVVQQVYSFFMSNTLEVMGNNAVIMPLVVLLIAIFLVFFSGRAISRGWIR